MKKPMKMQMDKCPRMSYLKNRISTTQKEIEELNNLVRLSTEELSKGKSEFEKCEIEKCEIGNREIMKSKIGNCEGFKKTDILNFLSENIYF